MKRRYLLAVSFKSLVNAALLHTIMLLSLTFAGRIRGDAFLLGLTYGVYPVWACLSVFVYVYKKKKHESDENTMFQDESVMLYCVCIFACFYVSAVTSILKLPDAKFYFLNALLAILGAFSLPMNRLNSYIVNNQERFISSKAISLVFRFNDRIITIIYLTLLFVSVPLFYYSQQLQTQQNDASIYINVSVNEIVPEVATDDKKIQALTVHDDHEALPVDYVFETKGETWIFNSQWVYVVCLTLMVIIIIFSIMAYRRLIARKNVHSDDDLPINWVKVGRNRMAIMRLLQKPFGLTSYNMRIRHVFYKKVRSHMKTGLSVSLSSTSASIARDINKEEDISHLEILYRTARYSKNQVTKKEFLSLMNRYPETK